MGNSIFYVLAVVALVLGAFIGVFIQRNVTSKRIGEANDLARRIVDEARKEAQAQKKEILLQGQNEVFSQKHALEAEYKEQERVLKNREKKLQDITLKAVSCHFREDFLKLVSTTAYSLQYTPQSKFLIWKQNSKLTQ